MPHPCRHEEGPWLRPGRAAADKYHGVQKFDVVTGVQAKSPAGPPSYTNVFAQALIAEAQRDEKIVAITAAMPSGTGLDKFQKPSPAGPSMLALPNNMPLPSPPALLPRACGPLRPSIRPFFSAPMIRLCMNVAIQNLPVRFAIDRAGLVGADGSTHAGSFDVTYLCTLPNFVVMAAADEAELVHMVHTCACHDSGPIAVRYPRGNGTGVPVPTPERLEIGKGRVIRQGKKVAILSLGTRLEEALKAADLLEARGLSTTVADLRFAKPARQ